jgi:hypothetical protein
VPSEPPAIVADHAAARDLATAISEGHTGEPDEPRPAASPAAAGPKPDVEGPHQGTDPAGATAAPAPDPVPEIAPNDRTAPSQPPSRPGFGARPPQIGGVRPAPTAPSRPDPAPADRTQEAAAAPDRASPGPASPPPVRPHVGSVAPRVGGMPPVAGVAQPRTLVGPRLGGPVTRPTMASRPAPARPGPIAAVAGRPAGAGGIGRAGGAAPSSGSHMWRGQTEDIEDGTDSIPF